MDGKFADLHSINLGPGLFNEVGQQADVYQMRFIEPGLVHYEDMGTVFVRKETLDKMTTSFVGRPVFNEMHKDVSNKDFSAGRADGIVTRVWFDPKDAWYWADVAIWDPETKLNCKSGDYSLSCAYNVSQWSNKTGVHNNIPYSNEVLDGEYTHLAIVVNPRYEGAKIIYNTGGKMKFAFWKKEGDKPEVRNASEIDGDKATISLDGKDVPVSELAALYNSKQAENALKNASDSDLLEIGGVKVTLGDLKKTYLENARANDDDDDDEEKKKKKKDEEEKDRENAQAKEEELKNQVIAEAKAKAEGKGHFEKVRELANNRPGEFAKPPDYKTQAERAELGHERYGKK